MLHQPAPVLKADCGIRSEPLCGKRPRKGRGGKLTAPGGSDTVVLQTGRKGLAA